MSAQQEPDTNAYSLRSMNLKDLSARLGFAKIDSLTEAYGICLWPTRGGPTPSFEEARLQQQY